MSSPATFAQRLGGIGSVYGAGAVVLVVLHLANVAVLSRLLSPGEFGRLVTFLVIGEMLPIAYNLGSLQGSLSLAFGAAADDDAGDDPEHHDVAQDPRAILGTGLMITVGIALAGTAVLMAFAEPLAGALVNDGGAADGIRLAALTGGLLALWRLASTVPRYERRPVRFVVLQILRSLLVLAGAVAFTAAGGGSIDAMTGVVAGTAVAVVLALAASRRHYRLVFRRRDARAIFERGRAVVPIVTSFSIVRHADVLILSQFVPASSVAAYRVAARSGAFVGLPLTAFVTAWSTLVREPVHASWTRADDPAVVRGRIATWFVLGMLWLLLAVFVAADLLVKIAPPEYAGAAPLIPLIAAGLVAHGVLVVLNRAAAFPGKRSVYTRSAVTSAVVFLVAAVAAVPAWGTYGAAIAVIVGPAAGAALMLHASQHGPHPIPIPYRRLALALAAAALLAAGVELVEALAPAWKPLAALLALAAYPVALVGARVVSGSQVRLLADLLLARRPRRSRRRRLIEQLHLLPPRDRAVLQRLARGRSGLRPLAAASGVAEDEVASQATRSLRRVAGQGADTELDAAIGHYVAGDLPVSQRDALLRDLCATGADPDDIEDVLMTLAQLRRLRARDWRNAPMWQPEDRVSPEAI